MKQILKLLSGIVLVSVAGCNIDKPSLGALSMWEKPSADFTEIGKALLECGMPTPYDVFPENQQQSINAKATVDACMVQAGFRYKDQRGGGGVILLKRKTCRFVVQVLSYHSAVSRSA